MKKIRIIFTCLTLIFFGGMLVMRYCVPAEEGGKATNSESAPVDIAQTVKATEPDKPEESESRSSGSYRIKEYKGNIAVFESGSSKPFRITDIAVKDLPVADQNDLNNGIMVDSQEELQTLLEDYLS